MVFHSDLILTFPGFDVLLELELDDEFELLLLELELEELDELELPSCEST